jgi:hypothetical protein
VSKVRGQPSALHKMEYKYIRVKGRYRVISHVWTAAVNPEVADPRDLSRDWHVTAAILFYKMVDFLPLFQK